MVNKRTATFMTFLIITLFLFQLIPSSFANVEGVDCHANNTKAVFLSSNIHNDILFINRDNRGASYNKIPTRIPTIFVSEISSVGVPLTNSLLNHELADNRKEIKQAIPHYFHGGKYKYNHFAI